MDHSANVYCNWAPSNIHRKGRDNWAYHIFLECISHIYSIEEVETFVATFFWKMNIPRMVTDIKVERHSLLLKETRPRQNFSHFFLFQLNRWCKLWCNLAWYGVRRASWINIKRLQTNDKSINRIIDKTVGRKKIQHVEERHILFQTWVFSGTGIFYLMRVHMHNHIVDKCKWLV